MQLDAFVRLALQEDLGEGDHTSLACIEAHTLSKAKLLVKDHGILAGLRVSEAIYQLYDPQLRLEYLLHDGAQVQAGDVAFYLHGRAQSILAVERLSLNIMQRMSGIATATAKVMQQLEGTACKVLDTRKTTPLNRFLEKEAVRIGGGTNHRFGLYDMIMIKDNHVDYAGGIEAAIRQTHDYLQKEKLELDIEVEARNLDEVKQIVAVGGIRRIMLDAAQGVEQGLEYTGRPHKVQVAPDVVLVELLETNPLGLALAIGAQQPHAGGRLLYPAGDRRKHGLNLFKPAVDPAAIKDDEQTDHRRRRQSGERQHGVDTHHDRKDDDKHEQRLAAVHQPRPRHHPDGIQVVC